MLGKPVLHLGGAMPLMEWSEKYSVGVQQFDNDHKHLFKMVNDLNDAMRSGKGREVLAQVLAALVTYTQRHFAAEEAAMKRTRYAEYIAHAQEHGLLTAEVQKLLRGYQAGNTLISIDVLLFLRDWLDKHVLTSDLKYSQHLAANGVS